MEVYRLFAARIPQRGRAAMRELSSRTRHGLVPDFMMWIRLGRDPVKKYLVVRVPHHVVRRVLVGAPIRERERDREEAPHV